MKLQKMLLTIAVGYLILKFGVPLVGSWLHPGAWPVIPTSVMKMYMTFVIVGSVLVYTFDEEGYRQIVGPILDLYGDPGKVKYCYAATLAVALLGAWVAYEYVKPTFDAPVELRSVHPAPPSSVKMWGKSYNLATLENPLRADKENFAKNSEEGGVVYYQNCFYCHGDLMDGKGHFATGFNNPLPANFVDVGTIAQLTESFVFWRIGSGGPGLPGEGAPWLSPMPIWHTLLSEDEVWKVILFLYDYTGHSPRVTEKHEG
ncbi:MAG: cytochrome c [Nitrospinae bacterium]|nr:cytochrome c [Nitrospinota bacterium]